MTNMITNAGEDEIPPVVGTNAARVSWCVTARIELSVVGCKGEEVEFIKWALNQMEPRTVTMDQNPSSSLNGTIDKRLSPINIFLQS